MAVKPPPGRAGRQWLVRRLEVARRGSDVLDQKRQALLRERERLAALLREAEEQWCGCAQRAADANARALALIGERGLRLAAAHCRERAVLSLRRRNVLGTVTPDVAALNLPDTVDLVALGGAPAAIAASVHRRALEAAATYAAARAGYDAISAELAATSRRLSAIERRWIPQHEQALARLDLALDESERDDIARVRWALESQEER